jgi:ATP-dependent DNA helicase RecG
VKFTRRPASEGKGDGISGGVNGGITDGIGRLAYYIRNIPGRNVTEITAALDIPQRTVERWIKKLREQGEIVFSGPRKSGGYFVSR